MKRFLLFLIIPFLFFLFNNTQPASAPQVIPITSSASTSATCCTNPFDQSTCFKVERTCFSDSNCAYNEYCDYGGAWCGWPFTSWPPALGGPCKPLDCKDCQKPQSNKCVDDPYPSTLYKCCSYSCIEGGLANSYSKSLYDQKCYDFKDVTNDANNCGTCGNKCTGGQ